MERSLDDRIQESERKYHLLANNLIDVIWVLDIETMKYVFITPSVEKISGYTVEEAKALTMKERLTPESFKKAWSFLTSQREKFLKGQDVQAKLELEMYHKNGSTFWVEVKARFFQEGTGPVRLLGVSKDITERKRFEMEREELIERLEEALKEKERLLKENRVLRGLLPICCECKRIRDENGNWWDIEEFVEARTQATFTHTYCPDCRDRLYPDLKTRT